MAAERGGFLGALGVASEETATDGPSSSGEHRRADGPGHPLTRDLVPADATPDFQVCLRVGRLLEIQVWHLEGPEQQRGLSECIMREARRAPSRPIIFADYRKTSPFPQAVGDAWARAMRSFKDHFAYSAILLAPSNETFNLQLERVARCADNPRRRLFREKRELYDWLAERTTAPELARLAQLLRDPLPAGTRVAAGGASSGEIEEQEFGG
jgi:hypothetical protein